MVFGNIVGLIFGIFMICRVFFCVMFGRNMFLFILGCVGLIVMKGFLLVFLMEFWLVLKGLNVRDDGEIDWFCCIVFFV